MVRPPLKIWSLLDYLQGMKQFAPILIAATLLAAPASAQDSTEPESEFGQGLDLFNEGARMMLEGLRREVEPMLEDVRPFLEREMVPFLQDLGAMMEDLSAYHPPERLPNGDILIRRRDDAPPLDALPEIGEGGEVEL